MLDDDDAILRRGREQCGCWEERPCRWVGVLCNNGWAEYGRADTGRWPVPARVVCSYFVGAEMQAHVKALCMRGGA